MRFMYFAVASLALLAVCACVPAGQEAIQRIPEKGGPTPSATGKDGVKSGAVGGGASASEPKPPAARPRRDLAGQESDLLPSSNDVAGSPFSENSQLEGRSRIRVLPAYLG